MLVGGATGLCSSVGGIVLQGIMPGCPQVEGMDRRCKQEKTYADKQCTPSGLLPSARSSHKLKGKEEVRVPRRGLMRVSNKAVVSKLAALVRVMRMTVMTGC